MLAYIIILWTVCGGALLDCLVRVQLYLKLYLRTFVMVAFPSQSATTLNSRLTFVLKFPAVETYAYISPGIGLVTA